MIDYQKKWSLAGSISNIGSDFPHCSEYSVHIYARIDHAHAIPTLQYKGIQSWQQKVKIAILEILTMLVENSLLFQLDFLRIIIKH
jgi:hypothetical protein